MGERTVSGSRGLDSGPYVSSDRPLWANYSDPEGTIDVHMHQRSLEAGGGNFLLWKANQNVGRLQLVNLCRLLDIPQVEYNVAQSIHFGLHTKQ